MDKIYPNSIFSKGKIIFVLIEYHECSKMQKNDENAPLPKSWTS